MSVSRRTFVSTLTVLPLAARAIAQNGTPPHVAVIGAGAFGGWTALHLLRMGAKVTLIDAWGAGNSRSSSGDETRVIRAIYGQDRPYVEMVKRAFELWTELDATTDETLYTETGALWMHRGDDAYVRSSLAILKELGFPVDELSVDDASKRYPQIDYRGLRSLFFERRAGALYARRACMAVRDEFTKAGGTFRIAQVTPDAIKNDALSGVRFSDGTSLTADAYVFACGPWLGKLFPEVLGNAIRPTRQEVFYFGAPRGSQNYTPGRFPVWIDFGERIFYGVPDIASRGFKIADDTRGEDVDPTTMDRTPSAEAITRARNLIAERFPEMVKAPLLESRVCQYENSPDGHLIIDRHPHAKNAWFVGGGSGHGFKLSPAVGEMTAQRVLTGKEVPKLFHLERLRDATKPKTQFDS